MDLQAPWITLLSIVSALAALTVAFAIISFLVRRHRRLKNGVVSPFPESAIDLAQLPQGDLEQLEYNLEFHSTPVRLAAMVIAPKGHSTQLPNEQQLHVLIERITPNMNQVLIEHQPVVQVWPAQMSVEGFSHSFFNYIQLPGDDGRGTPWCGIAGHFSIGMGSVLVGFICVANQPNQLGQITLQHEGQWRDVLRVSNPN